MIALSLQQDAAVAAVLDWLLTRSRPVFKLFGYAGTGKTTIAKNIAEAVRRRGDHAVFAAFTGKAASVLRSKGCTPCTTIHGLIYRPVETDEPEDGTPLAQAAAAEPSSGVEFELTREKMRRERPDLVIIDECSMVGEEMGRDLLSFGVPVLVLGDPAQLPPVAGGGFFTNGEPDVLLTEIHRQKEGCGILDIATAVRIGERLAFGQYEESAVVELARLTSLNPLSFDQILVGKNATRRKWNEKARALLGRSGPLPVEGDRLICLRNNHALGLMNGEQVQALRVEPSPLGAYITFRCDGRLVTRECPSHYWAGAEGHPPWSGDEWVFFDYAYAVTVYKAQGSQWDSVLVLDYDTWGDVEQRRRHLYTAVTRAAKSVVVVR